MNKVKMFERKQLEKFSCLAYFTSFPANVFGLYILTTKGLLVFRW